MRIETTLPAQSRETTVATSAVVTPIGCGCACCAEGAGLDCLSANRSWYAICYSLRQQSQVVCKGGAKGKGPRSGAAEAAPPTRALIIPFRVCGPAAYQFSLKRSCRVRGLKFWFDVKCGKMVPKLGSLGLVLKVSLRP